MNTRTFGIAGCLAGALLGLAAPAGAQVVPDHLQPAAQLRQLDMMLMVTSLRCRTGPDDFQPEYERFRANYMPQLRSAAMLVMTEFTRQVGARGAVDAFDRMSVSMANEFGAGHPRLSCGELKEKVAELAVARGEEPLAEASALLLGPGREPIRVARR